MFGWMKAAASRFSLPEELLPGVPRLTLTGRDSLRIENQKCLLSYTPEEVEVGCGRLRLRVRGRELLLGGMDREELLITGTVDSVEVEGT